MVAWSPRRRLSPFGWVTADDEPVTPIPNGFSLDWLCEDSSLPQDCWEEGVLKMDTSITSLGATKYQSPVAPSTQLAEPGAWYGTPGNPSPGCMKVHATLLFQTGCCCWGRGQMALP